MHNYSNKWQHLIFIPLPSLPCTPPKPHAIFPSVPLDVLGISYVLRAGHQTEKILLHAFFCTTLQVMHVEAKKSENFCHLPWSRGSRSL